MKQIDRLCKAWQSALLAIAGDHAVRWLIYRGYPGRRHQMAIAGIAEGQTTLDQCPFLSHSAYYPGCHCCRPR